MKRFRQLTVVICLALSMFSWEAFASDVPSQSTGKIVPLSAPTPEWFTPDLQEQVRQTGFASAPADAPLPGEVGIRPGSWMISPFWCTMNFVFVNGSRLGIGTAGHCAKNGQSVTLLTLAPGSGNPVLVNIGNTIVSHDGGIGNDFALIEIKPALHSWVFPTIAEVGGPCGLHTGDGVVSVDNPIRFQGELIPSTFDVGDTVYHYGHGLGVGTGGTPRSGAVLAWYPDSYTFASASIPGDSGSPVRVQDLKAAGNLTHGLGVAGVVPLPAPAYGTRITKILSMISSWSLVNSYALNGDSPIMACPPGTPPTSGGGGGSNGGGGGRGKK